MRRTLIAFIMSLISLCAVSRDITDEGSLMELKIKGYEMIRHDAFRQWKFRYARYMKIQIQKSQLELINIKQP